MYFMDPNHLDFGAKELQCLKEVIVLPSKNLTNLNKWHSVILPSTHLHCIRAYVFSQLKHVHVQTPIYSCFLFS